jgi:hypothetical protein
VSVQQEAEVLRCLLNQHVESCFRSSRAKGNTKEENRQTCIHDIMSAALALALAAFDEGVAAALADGIATRYEGDRIARRRAAIEQLSQGEPAADDTPEAPHVLTSTPGIGETAGD